MSEGTGHPPAGWYPDGRGAHRWWDGSAWTEHTGGSPGAPPPGAAPAPPQAQPPAASSSPGPSGPPPSQPPPGQSFGWQQSSTPGPRGGYPAAGGFPAAGAPGGPGGWGGYPSTGPPPGPPPKSRKGLLIGGVVAAVLLVVGLGVVLALTLGGSDSEGDTAAPGGDESSSGPADDSEEPSEPSESSEPDEPSDTGGTGGSDDPAATAVEYLEAQLAVDLERLCELSSEEKREVYTAGSSDGTCAGVPNEGEASPTVPGGDDSAFTFVTEVTEQDEDTATVEYELDVTGDATPGESLDDPFGRLSMVLEDDQWRVDDEEFIR